MSSQSTLHMLVLNGLPVVLVECQWPKVNDALASP